MKAITYSLLVLMVFGMVATGYLNKPQTPKTVLIEARENNISPQVLSESANIIANRLKDFSDKKFGITLIPGSGQIKVKLASDWNTKIVGRLLTQKGQIGFYETYNRKELQALLQDNGRLFSMLESDGSRDSGPETGCTAQAGDVNNYLQTLTVGQKCRFAWNTSAGDSNWCLYALRLNDSTGALMTGTDIGSMKFEKSQHPDMYWIGVDFKKPAAEKWAAATRRNIGRSIAVVIDGTVVSAPVVREEIRGGACQITGNYTEDEVRYFAAIGNNGELPVGFRVVR